MCFCDERKLSGDTMGYKSGVGELVSEPQIVICDDNNPLLRAKIMSVVWIEECL